MEFEKEKERKKCDACQKSFSDISNLRRHIRKEHKNDPKLMQFKYKEEHLYSFTCHCGKNFSRKNLFTYHLKSHSAGENEVSPIQLQKCPLCQFNSSLEKNLFIHFKNKHDIELMQENLEFGSFEEFERWKYNVECDTSSRFISLRSKSLSLGKYVKYACNRSGYYTPSVQNHRTRFLKTQGTNKINGLCPASMILQISESGKCTCKFIKSHIGHNNDLGHLYLSPLERRVCAEKIASKVPFNVILDQVRDSVSDSKLHRLHLLTRKDLCNIEKSYNLCSDAIRHQNDATSVEAWVNEMNQKGHMCVLFYKPQDKVDEEYSQLKKNDFILIIMNQAQCEILKKFGTDCICLDSTHGMNSYDFQLTTLMIIDDMRQGFPCTFLISNRVDKEVLNVFFFHVRMYSNVIAPKVFMTDIAESFYNAWIDIMEKPVIRLYCSWHIDQAWRKNLTKIRIRDKQIEVYKSLRTIMEERHVTAFCRMRDQFCKSLLENLDTQEFGEYFINYYTKNCESWAYCFRLNSGINTNMHLERMHRTLKHIYLDGKRVRRLDKAVCAIMKFIKDKLFDRIIILNKGKITSKLRDIGKRHKTSLNLNPAHVIQSEHGWEVLSSKNQEIYHIKEVNPDCKCQLSCQECNVCLHKYSCSCIDSSIKWIICKHIHLLGRKLLDDMQPCMEQNSRGMEIQEPIQEENTDLQIVSDDEAKMETNFLTSQITNNIDNEASSVNRELELIKNQFLDSLINVKRMAQVEVVKKCIAPIKPTLQALENCSSHKPIKSIPANKKILAQRRFYTTKKTSKRTKKPAMLRRPSYSETQNIAVSLINTLSTV